VFLPEVNKETYRARYVPIKTSLAVPVSGLAFLMRSTASSYSFLSFMYPTTINTIAEIGITARTNNTIISLISILCNSFPLIPYIIA
ncbi:hypothetical protein, partial [Helicobacter apodemus]|uniref:hypothetical protein n=1 Tax=Helicobacter apodemus TaxID=135569 RepID=UPI001EE8DB2D